MKYYIKVRYNHGTGVRFPMSLRRCWRQKYGRGRGKEDLRYGRQGKGVHQESGYRRRGESFVVPDDVGGRFSVLTAVGLLPIAVSGADIDN